MYNPDFLIKPYEVHACKELRPSDGDVYAVVYWFERLRGERCTAGDRAIGEVARVGERSVRGSLTRLEKSGFIERVYDGEKRVEIRTLVHMTRTQSNPIHKTDSSAVKALSTEELEPGAVIPVAEKEPTPGELAKDFFAPPGSTSKYREQILDEVVKTTGAQRDAVLAEARKFYTYWTEPTKSGTKQRWETEKTFEIRRRLYKWLSNVKTFGPRKPNGGTGSGATI